MKLKLLTVLTCFLVVSGQGNASIKCPPMPNAVTDVNKDVRSDISGSVAALGKVKAGDISVKTEVVAKNLFDKYPNVDRLVALQTMAATYCQMLDASNLTDNEKLARWERFQEKVLNLQAEPLPLTGSQDKKSKQSKPATGKQVSNSASRVLPGDTGWIFAGYFNVERDTFIEGPYVSVQDTRTRRIRSFVEIGDTISLKVSRDVHIVDYKKTGAEQKLVPPITKGIIDEYDKTGITLPAGTQLIVRDISEGKWPDSQNAALWIRVVYVPK